MAPAALSLLESRIVGVLVEKQRAVPDTYPLTLNALTAGCNQKTSRDPVLAASDAEVRAALDRLKEDAWIVESSGGRVMRYAHNVERVLGVPSQSAALLATLMLRGPQTAGELRINSDRLHRFADISAVEAFLHVRAARPAGALVVELPRAPGARETRWPHLLSGAPPDEALPVARRDAAVQSPAPDGDVTRLGQDVAALREEVDALRAEVATLRAQLGAPPPGG
jgi:uncharacterized protein YceH (UPF0502 family)